MAKIDILIERLNSAFANIGVLGDRDLLMRLMCCASFLDSIRKDGQTLDQFGQEAESMIESICLSLDISTV